MTGFFSDGTQKNFTQKVIYSSNDPASCSRRTLDGNARARRGRRRRHRGRLRDRARDRRQLERFGRQRGDGGRLGADPDADVDGPTPTRTFTPQPTATATPVLVSLVDHAARGRTQRRPGAEFLGTATYSNGDDKNVTQSSTYLSSDPAVVQCPNDISGNRGQTLAVGVGVATISARVRRRHHHGNRRGREFTVVVPPTPTATRTGATPTPTFTAEPTATATPVLVSLALSPPAAKQRLGAFQNFVATATFSDGATKNFTQQVIYSSSDPEHRRPRRTSPPTRAA